MKDIKKFVSILLAMTLCMTAIPFSFVNAETEVTKTIYQIDPSKSGQIADTDVTTSEPYFVADAGVKTYVRGDDDGLYYSTEVTAFSGEKYIYFDSGWNESTLPLLGNADVLNKLLDYMQISVDIRIVSEATIDKDISVQLLAYPNANNILHYTDGGVNVSADGQWHTFTRSGTGGSLSGTYLNKVLMITSDIPADLKIEIRNLSVSLKESDKDAIDAALAGTDYTYESLTGDVEPEYNMIYQIEPGKVGQTTGENVTGSCSGMGPSAFQTYVREDKNGYYYSTEVGANSGEYSYVDTGWTGETMPLLGAPAVLEKLLPYMQISIEARIVSDAELTEDVKLQILSMPHYEEYFRYSDDYVPVDSEWHTFTRSGTDGVLAWRFHGTLALDIKNNNDADVKVEFRNLSVSLKSTDKDAINAELEGTDFTYESLIQYVPYVHPEYNMIYQIEPGKVGQTEGTNVTGSCDGMGASAFQTYVREDENGYYYSAEIGASSGAYSYVSTGWTSETLPLLGAPAVIEKLLPYMQISVDARVISEDELTEDVSLQILSMPHYAHWFRYAQGTVPVDGEWHTFTRNGTDGGLSSYYHGVLALDIVNNNAADIKVEFRNFSVSLKSTDKDAINAALEGTDFTYESLIQYVPYVHPEYNMIYQIEPGKVGQTEGTNVTGSCDGMGASAFQTYVREDENGYYYSAEIGASSGAYSYVNTGWTSETLPLLGAPAVIEKLLPYMQISVDVRVISDAELTEDVSLQILSMPHYAHWFRYAQGTVPVDGEWHTFTRNGTDGGLSSYYHGVLALDIVNNNAADIKVEFRNFSVSLKSTDKDAINAALEGTEYTYESLIEYVPYVYDPDANKIKNHLIYQVSPKNCGFSEGDKATGYCKGMADWTSNNDTYVRKDSQGLYFSTEVSTSGNSENYIVKSNYANVPILLQPDAMKKILPYLQISVDVRVVSEQTLSEDVSFTLTDMPHWSTYIHYFFNESVTADGEWHTFTASGASGDVNGSYAFETLRLVLNNPSNSAIKFEFRNLYFSFNEADAKKINSALSGTEFTYESLIEYVENDVNDDDSFDIRDLVSLKRYTAGAIDTPEYVLDRMDKEITEKLDATDLTNVKTALLNKTGKETTYSITDYFDSTDMGLYNSLDHVELLDGVDPRKLEFYPGAETYSSGPPTDELQFMHSSSIIECNGILISVWFSNEEKEQEPPSHIRGSISKDGGKTWSEAKTYVFNDYDVTGEFYVTPMLGKCNGKVYMFVSTCVGFDRTKALYIYEYDAEKDEFIKIREQEEYFLTINNAVQLTNGRYMLPVLAALEQGEQPRVAAYFLSEVGTMDCEWELVKIDNDGEFAPGYESIIPETSVIVNGDNITMFARDDNYRVPIMYKSSDNGATWTDALTHDIPFVSSKITSGALSDGRNYIIGNIFYSERTRLAIFFTEPGGEKFTSGYLIQDGLSTLNNGADIAGCHYPTACEYDGKLIISFTANYCGGNKRGAAVTILDLDLLK